MSGAKIDMGVIQRIKTMSSQKSDLSDNRNRLNSKVETNATGGMGSGLVTDDQPRIEPTFGQSAEM